jgi:prepilin-type N-terminal cleavage/methylation domain-containing protein
MKQNALQHQQISTPFAPAASKRQAGFTLIEVMVALAILAALSLLTAQTLKSTFDNRVKVESDLNRESQVFDALRIMQNDVGAAFHYRDIQGQIDTLPAQTTGTPGTTPPPLGTPVATPVPTPGPNGAAGTPHGTPVDVTGFVGDNKSMYFTVSNHTRTSRDAKESDQAKVGYYLKSCHSRTGKKEASQCLYRAVSPMLDDDVTKIEDETMLLEHVDEFKLRYLGPGHDDYVESWKTGQAGTDAAAKTNFPFAVEITLVTFNKSDKKEKQFGATVLAPLRFPNNPKSTPGPGGVNSSQSATRPNL